MSVVSVRFSGVPVPSRMEMQMDQVARHCVLVRRSREREAAILIIHNTAKQYPILSTAKQYPMPDT